MPLRRNSSIDPEPAPACEESGAEEAAAFIAETLCNLTSICHRHRFDTLGYLLDMARMEAESLVQARGKSGH